MQHGDEVDERIVSRRRLLKGGSVVAAGAAGAVVGGAVAAMPASAAAGDPVIQGVSNTAGAAATGLTASPTLDRATLELSNGTVAPPDVHGIVRGGATLRLTPHGDLLSDTAPPGSIGMATDGTLWAVPALFQGQPFRTFVYTDSNANMMVPLNPDRVIDTRDPAQRVRIFNPGALDGLGRVAGGQTIDIDLSDYTFFATAVFINITAVTPVSNGFLTVFPTGTPRPPTSNLNYQSNVFAWSNYAVSPVGSFAVSTGDVRDAISVLTSASAHIIVDIAAVQAPGPGNVNPAHQFNAPAKGANTARPQATRRVTPPTWHTAAH
jgi:hypothetical protein